MKYVLAALVPAVLAVALGGHWSEREGPEPGGGGGGALAAVSELRDGWVLRAEKTLPAPVNSLTIGPPGSKENCGLVFAGLAGGGDVYRFNSEGAGEPTPIGQGLGDRIKFGTCLVNRLALHDLDGDGLPEILGSTSQVDPMGVPRLCVWSSALGAPVLRAVARPEIRSSWSHSVGFVGRPGRGRDSAFITFCGFGEVVEYRLEESKPDGGFQGEAMTWKVVGQLPHSGEWLQVADADNDGRPEICVATGYAIRGAAVHFFESDTPGADLRQIRVLNEDSRYGNVRFILGDFRGDGRTDLIAWWCTDLAGGDAEMILYRLGRDGVASRSVIARGPADELWPDDGQFTTGDLDGDGREEVWFGTHAGHLWRYDPAHESSPVRVVRFNKPLGPIAVGPDYFKRNRQRVYLGLDRSVLKLEGDEYRSGMPAPESTKEIARRLPTPPRPPRRPSAGTAGPPPRPIESACRPRVC